MSDKKWALHPGETSLGDENCQDKNALPRSPKDKPSPSPEELKSLKHSPLFDSFRPTTLGTRDPHPSEPSSASFSKDKDPFLKVTPYIRSSPKHLALEEEILRLRGNADSLARQIEERGHDLEGKDAKIAELQRSLQSLNEKQSLAHLLNRVCLPAQNKILSDSGFRAQFSGKGPHNAFVLAIDLRRSTELMLKARHPQLYARFIGELVDSLRKCVIENYGVFDKFTGDGILCFFPDFYSGPDSGYHALNVAGQCHRIFATHYQQCRNCFIAVMKDVGLGIGVDFGVVDLVEIGGELTAVGSPVVYACRLAGGRPGTTLLNQSSFERVSTEYKCFDFDETEIAFKHEGLALAYSVGANGESYKPASPNWSTETGTHQEA